MEKSLSNLLILAHQLLLQRSQINALQFLARLALCWSDIKPKMMNFDLKSNWAADWCSMSCKSIDMRPTVQSPRIGHENKATDEDLTEVIEKLKDNQEIKREENTSKQEPFLSTCKSLSWSFESEQSKRTSLSWTCLTTKSRIRGSRPHAYQMHLRNVRNVRKQRTLLFS